MWEKGARVGARVGRKRRWDGMGKKKVKSARGRKVDCGSGKRRMKRVGARDGGEEGGISPFNIQAVIFNRPTLAIFIAGLGEPILFKIS
jgi:hypothetical protein